MKILVIGSSGQLGWELCGRGKTHGFEVISLDIPEFDVTDPAAVKKAVNNPDAVGIGTAMYPFVGRRHRTAHMGAISPLLKFPRN